jgi:branched-chain amino acid transport system substrate-binding protein
LWDLSGDQGREGRASFIAARRAVEDVNSQGGVSGRRLEIVISDTEGQPGELLAHARSLVDREHVIALLGPTRDTLATTIRTFGEGHGVPVILTAGEENLVPDRSGRSIHWTFSVRSTFGTEIKALYSLLSRTGLGPVGPLVEDTPPGETAGLWLRAYGPEKRLPVLPPQTFGAGDTDVVTQLQYFRSQGAAIVVGWGSRDWGPVFLRSASQTNTRVAVPTRLLTERLLWARSPEQALWVAAPPLLLGTGIPPSHPCAFVVSRFLRAMGPGTYDLTVEELLAAGAAWDAVHLLAMGLREAGVPNREGLRRGLEELKQPYYGVLGIFRPSKRDHSGLSPQSLLVSSSQGRGWARITPGPR